MLLQTTQSTRLFFQLEGTMCTAKMALPTLQDGHSLGLYSPEGLWSWKARLQSQTETLLMDFYLFLWSRQLWLLLQTELSKCRPYIFLKIKLIQVHQLLILCASGRNLYACSFPIKKYCLNSSSVLTSLQFKSGGLKKTKCVLSNRVQSIIYLGFFFFHQHHYYHFGWR